MLNRFRLRAILLSLVTLVASTLLSVGASAPAQADPGTTCLAPSVSGDISRVRIGPFHWATQFTGTTGWTSASCTDTVYTQYRYEVVFVDRSADDDRVATAESNGTEGVYDRTGRLGTRISFSDTGMPGRASQGVYVHIATYTKGFWNSTWPDSPSEHQTYYVPATATSYDTAEMAQNTGCQITAGKIGCP